MNKALFCETRDSEVLGILQGATIIVGADVRTSKCHRHFGRCILKAKGL
jgi:hypothetical protein